MEVLNTRMYRTDIMGISAVSGDRVTVIGEQVVKLEDGRVLNQYLYHIVGYTAQNGKPFVSLKANIHI